ncbi:putative Zn-dependent peptidase [Bradyrhizobium ottawaense]
MLEQLMGGGVNSYLYLSLVVEKQLAVTARASYQSAALDPSLFAISAIPKPGVHLSLIEQSIDEDIADIARNPVSTEAAEREDAADCASLLCPGQSGNARAPVWPRPDDGTMH